jgi:hypothetical protein
MKILFNYSTKMKSYRLNEKKIIEIKVACLVDLYHFLLLTLNQNEDFSSKRQFEYLF